MELSILRFFETLQCGFGDFLACVFSIFGETLVLVLLICLLYWIYEKKLGEKLVLVTFSSMTVNGFIKSAVARPRPYVGGGVSRVNIDNAFISTVDLSAYESFPSGHSQLSAGLFFTGAFRYRKLWAWIVFPVLTLGVMCSRLYFGVHYPTDVLVGATMGIAFACFWEFIYQEFEGKKYYVFGVFALLSILFTVLYPSKNMIEMCACTSATAVCVPIENKFIRFEDASGVKNRIFRALIGIACVGIVFGAFSLPLDILDRYVFKFFKYFLTVVVATLVAPFLFRKLKI